MEHVKVLKESGFFAEEKMDLNGKLVSPPELAGKYKPCFDYILNYLEERNISYVKSSKVID